MWDLALIADEKMFIPIGGSQVHELTSKVFRFPPEHFASYCRIVIGEMIERNIDYSVDIEEISKIIYGVKSISVADIFIPWMDAVYLQNDYWRFMRDNRLTELEQYQICKVIEETFYKIC